MNTMLSKSTHGYTLLEMLVALSIASILIIALIVFMGRFFIVSREQFEQIRITEDARREMERISDALRNAQYTDLNGNGYTNDTGEQWLQLGQDTEIKVFANVDSDNEAELVRYYVDTTDTTLLMRDVIQPNGTAYTGVPITITLTRSLRNAANGLPVFTYYTGAGTQLTTPLTSGQLPTVARIGINLKIDVSEQVGPSVTTVYTEVSPRGTPCNNGECQPVGGSGCVDPGAVALGPYLYSGSSFIEDSAQACYSHCQTNLGPPQEGTPVYLDDAAANFSTTGTWALANNGLGYQGNYSYANPTDDADTATWSFTVTAGEDYRAAANWFNSVFYASNVAYTISDGVGQLASGVLNEQLPPDDVMEGGTGWEYLGDPVTVRDTTLTVQFSSPGADSWVIADGIRIVPITYEPMQCCPWTVTYAWDGQPNGNVTADCSCQSPSYSFSLNDTHANDDLTTYYKARWNECLTTTGGATAGTVGCNMGCDLTAPTAACGVQCP